ncbi:hypothetical protein P1X14_16165 [Sphingomonas sp. AOB5]|uniref:hypothetical protein n=1 Tax=Sphingomonas sp. AOB5 TaxID=3034017 RepID=UPI0023F8D619|nr:hypothetical protein [Sphingomonas sp. AOB5]MDF7776792.1 hypothetical protein [Sphingomonas sp. AOB5]
MDKRLVKWLVYTCLIGLVPVIARAFVWSVSNGTIQPVAVGDLIAFGLVLHVSIINEIEGSNEITDGWKTFHNGISIVFITLYGLMLGVTIYPNLPINEYALIRNTAIMSSVSFMLSLSIFYSSIDRSAESS